jgi:hypothetical protein
MMDNEASQTIKRGNSEVIPEEDLLIESAGPRSFRGREDLICNLIE